MAHCDLSAACQVTQAQEKCGSGMAMWKMDNIMLSLVGFLTRKCVGLGAGAVR